MTVSIEEAHAELAEKLMALESVTTVGIGECEGEPCIRVWVVSKTTALEEKIPDWYEGFRVHIDESGEIRALTDDV